MWFNIQFPHFTTVHIALCLLKKLYEICLATPVTENFPDLQCSKLSTVQVLMHVAKTKISYTKETSS